MTEDNRGVHRAPCLADLTSGASDGLCSSWGSQWHSHQQMKPAGCRPMWMLAVGGCLCTSLGLELQPPGGGPSQGCPLHPEAMGVWELRRKLARVALLACSGLVVPSVVLSASLILGSGVVSRFCGSRLSYFGCVLPGDLGSPLGGQNVKLSPVETSGLG